MILTKAPDWRVYCFHPDSKVIWSGKPEEFDIRYVMLPPLLRESPDPKKVYSDRIWEEASILKTMHRVDGGKFEQLSYESFEYTTRGDRYYLRTTNDILIDPQGARFLATLAGTVAKGHVPLYLSASGLRLSRRWSTTKRVISRILCK